MSKEKANDTKFNPENIKKVRNVTLPILTKVDDVAFYIKIILPIYLGKATIDDKGVTQKPAPLTHVIDLKTGEEMCVVLNEVLNSNLKESYENDSYVGKCFMITQYPKAAGKKYKTYSIIEIEA